MNQRGIAPIIIILIVVGVLVVGGSGYYAIKKSQKPAVQACTQEAKICPDGSSVGRTGPNCEFTACPEQKSETAKLTPEATIAGYVKALKAGNIDEALKYVSIDVQERQQSVLAELDESFRKLLADAFLNSSKTYESETMIIYKVTITSSDGRIIEDTFRLVKENGDWKISGL